MKKSNKNILDKIQIYITGFIILTLIIALFLEFINQRWMLFFVSAITLILILLPYFFQRTYRIYIPAEIQLIIVLFIYAGVFLGEVHNFYVRFWWWAPLLHLISGFVLGLIIFAIMYVLYKQQKIKTSIFFITILIFSMTITAGVFWELYEFGMDSFFGLNMQRSKNMDEYMDYCDTRAGLLDTMYDFVLNIIGALLSSIIAYIYLKKEDNFLINGSINRFIKKNPKLFKKKAK